MFYAAIINYQFKRSELKNVEKLVKQTVQIKALEPYKNRLEMWIFCTIRETVFLLGGPWKFNVVLEKSLKNGWHFLYEP